MSPRPLRASSALMLLGCILGPPAAVDAQEPVEEELPTETVEAPPEVLAIDEAEVPPRRTGALEGSEGPVVERIEVRSDAPLGAPRELRDLITITVGERLTESAVRQTLRNLQATGSAYEVELYTRPVEPVAPAGTEAAGEADRAVVVLVIRAAVQITAVSLEGDLGINRRTLEDRLLVAAGQPLIESRVLRSVYRLQDLYERRGYFGARVRLEVDSDAERKRAAIVFRVDSGPRARIGAVRFEGETGPFSRDRLVGALRAGPGDPYRRETVREGADRLQRWLVEQGYRTAEVDRPSEEVPDDVRGEEPRVDLLYPVRAGPEVRVEVVGAELKALRKKELLPFLGEEGYDEALVLQAVDRLRRHYQEQGHWKVRIDWFEEREDGVLRLELRIEPGPIYTLERMRFEGNDQVADAWLFELMETAPKRLLTLGSGRLITATLEEDLENIRSYYALQGFVGSRIGPPRTDVGSSDEGRSLTLVIPIEEGRRRQVVELAFDGVENLDLERVRADVPLEGGGPYHPILLEDTLRILRGRYEERGYPDAQVSAREDWNEAGTLVDVTIEVIEGPQTVIDRVILRGNHKTREEVLEEAIRLQPGEPVSRSRLLEVERRLYGLGIFSRVQVELGPADLAEETRDVIVRVEEGRTRRVSYGIGYGTDDGFAGLFGYSRRNLWGRAVTLQTDLRYGQKERLARAVLDQPSVTRWDLPVLYTLAVQEEERPSYDVERLVSQVEAVYQRKEWRYGLAFDYRIVNSTLEPLDPDDSLDAIERRDQDVRISSVIPNVFVDRRDDPIDPKTGWSAVGRVQLAFPLGGVTEADFVKTYLQHSRYVELGYGHLAGSARVGFIEPLADATEDPTAAPGTELPEEPPNLEIPIDERFFAGGDFSHRAYGKDELGIPGETLFSDGNGRGGNGLVVLNLDYRFPIWGDLGGVVFYDVGNVWPDWRELDPTELKSGVGLGVRYSSPIGPIRAGVAYKLDPEPTLDEDEWRLFLAVGNPF